MAVSDQCVLCRHYQCALACEAFPDGIPEEIITGEFDHTQPHAGDHGIRFEPVEARPTIARARR